MERAVIVYTTYPSVVEAERAGRAIVERRLAACVNILPGMVSHYWWQGALVSRFRSPPNFSARPMRTSESKDTSNLMILVPL